MILGENNQYNIYQEERLAISEVLCWVGGLGSSVGIATELRAGWSGD